MSYDIWKEPPIPIHLEIHLFNVTNADKMKNDFWGTRPQFSELGPYVFIETHKRVNVQWNDNGTVSYQQVRKWVFSPELSKGSLNDRITNLNMVVATISYLVRGMGTFVQLAVSALLKAEHESLLTTRTVRELLFDGYEDRVLKLVSKYVHVPFTRFGWFYGRNGSADWDGEFVIRTGVDSLERLGELTRYNGRPSTGMFPSPCGDVGGSTGELWAPPGPKPAPTVQLFASDACSAFTLELARGPLEKSAFDGVRYAGTARTFDNGSTYGEQKCFGSQLPSGLRDATHCR